MDFVRALLLSAAGVCVWMLFVKTVATGKLADLPKVSFNFALTIGYLCCPRCLQFLALYYVFP